METVFDLNDAQAQFDQLIERVERGEEIIITRDGHPIVRMIPYHPGRGLRPRGSREGKTDTSTVTMAEIVERAEELSRMDGGASHADVMEVIRAGRDQPGAPGDTEPTDPATGT